MSEQIKKYQTNYKMKIRNKTLDKEILDFKEIHQQDEELQLSIKLRQHENHFTLLENIQLDSYKNLISLNLKIVNLSIQDLKKVLTILESASNLKHLKFIISYDKSDIVDIQTCLGQSLCQMTKLETLMIDINYSQSPCPSSLFQLNQAYQNLSNLLSLSINLKYFHNSSLLIKQIFDGLRNLKNLLSLSFSINSHFGADENFYTFNEEIRYLINLKSLELQLSISLNLQAHKQKILSETLQCLTNLEEFKLLIYISGFKDAQIIRGLENLKNLKYLSFSTFQSANDNITIQFLEQIQKCIHLERVQLKISVTNYTINNQQINKLLKSIQKINNLTYLNFEFPNSNFLTLEVVFAFIADLKNQKQLKSLFLEFVQNDSQGKIEQLKILDCREVINNLKEFKITILENSLGQVNGNDLIGMLSSQQQLEKLSLNWRSFQHNVRTQQQIQSLDFLNNSSKLKELELQFNIMYSISEDDLRNLFEYLKNQKQLTKLTFKTKSLLPITNKVNYTISDAFSKLLLLESLNLDLEQFTFYEEECITYFWNAIKNLKQLKDLNLIFYSNFELNTLFKVMSDTFENLISLKQLSLKLKSYFRKDQINSMIEKVILPSNLRKLSLEFTQDEMEFKNVQEIFKSLIHLSQLQCLYISINIFDISLTDIRFLSNILINLEYLKDIQFDQSKLISIYLISIFQNLPILEFIDLELRKIENLQGYIFLSREQNMDTLYLKEQQERKETESCKNLNNILNDLSLDIYNYEEISQEDVKILCDFLQNNLINKLRIGIKRINAIQGNFFQFLRDNTSLQILQISITKQSEIATENILELGNSLKTIKQLKQFDFDVHPNNDKIDWVQAKEFFNGLKQVPLLEKLLISIKINNSFNQIQDLDFLLLNIGHLTILKQLKIQIDAKFQLEMVNSSLNKCFKGMPNLQQVNFKILIQQDQINYFKQFVKCFFNLQNLNHLCLPNNLSKCPYLYYKIKRLVKYIR